MSTDRDLMLMEAWLSGLAHGGRTSHAEIQKYLPVLANDYRRVTADLARALPVVEAAQALVPLIDVEMFHHDQSDCHCPARFDQGKHESYCAASPCGSECFRCALDALRREMDAGKGTG